jgi:hypothetical protein
MNRWFRHYEGLSIDPKFVSVAIASNQPVERVVWIWVHILESAAALNDGGRCRFDPRQIARHLQVAVEECNSIVTELVTHGMLQSVTGAFHVTSWDKRQYKATSSTDRVRRHREAKKLAKNNNLGVKQETVSCNASETLLKRTETETETDIYLTAKKVRRSNGPKPSASDPDFDLWYKTYPRREARGAAEKAYAAARKIATADELLAGATTARQKYTDPKFTPMPATWLNQKRWQDEGQDAKSSTRYTTGSSYV